MLERGRNLFNGAAQCSRCHKEDTLQDGQNHDVGTGGEYNTPSLLGVSSRKQLLHDGRALSIEQIFSGHDTKKLHGNLRDLGNEEKNALFAFLRSL
jgi:CxxC motif-containing protein (DUF1111 family)